MNEHVCRSTPSENPDRIIGKFPSIPRASSYRRPRSGQNSRSRLARSGLPRYLSCGWSSRSIEGKP